MKKVLHISKYYYPFIGGVEQIARDCVNALKGNYEQKVVCFQHSKDCGDTVESIDGVDVIRCKCQMKISSQSISFSYPKRLKQLIKEFCPDYIFFHYPNPFVSHYLLKNDLAKTKLIVYWHLDITKQKILGKLFHGQNIRLLREAHKVVATSPNYIEGSPYLSQFKEKCVVIPNCINENRLEVTEKAQKMAEKIRHDNKGKCICLAVGRHVPYKGFEYLIDATKYLDDHYKIYISGKGPLTDKLHELAKDNQNIIFLGLINDEELVAYLTACDIFCFSSITKNEAFGVALAEGMYFKKPAVTFTISGSGVNYVNMNGVTGIEVPNKDAKKYANAIKKLWENEELRTVYGKAAYQRVIDEFMFERFLENIKKLLDN